MTELTCVEFFAGISGFGLGFEQAGMKVIQQVEKDKYCNVVLEQHYPDVDRSINDVKEANRSNIANADVFCGGFPCQDVSIAGLRAGLAGERSGLWFEFHRIINEFKPSWVVIENVPGLLSSNGGRDFAVVLRGLANSGYGVSYRVLNSQYFGVAQRRRRVFVVGSLRNGRSAEVLFESKSSTGNIAESEKERKVTAAIPAYGAGTARHGNERTELSFLVPLASEADRLQTFGQYRKDSIASTLKDRDWKDATDLIVPSSGTVNGIDLSPPLRATGDAGEDGRGRRAFAVYPTLDGGTQGHKWGSNQWVDREYWHIDKGYVRRLTPVECERLQGFPDGWTAAIGEQNNSIDDESISYLQKLYEAIFDKHLSREDACKVVSDSQRYKMLGNAVTVNVAEWIGKRIVEASKDNTND